MGNSRSSIAKKSEELMKENTHLVGELNFVRTREDFYRVSANIMQSCFILMKKISSFSVKDKKIKIVNHVCNDLKKGCTALLQLLQKAFELAKDGALPLSLIHI
eukprot:TRINITY_DN21750_c0_g1_i4.p1 TRINITY_DN21750_c0_g1~~TRINITY_DN21750_c0_g1_i4.p1  ORF type:complete len:114 (-),score=29.41 TRINITY_DN21750_c0_g1_i4:56-367(-)